MYPNSRYVAELVGDVNLIEGRIVESGPDHALIESDECTLRAGYGVETPVGAPVAVALRDRVYLIWQADAVVVLP